MNPTLNPTPKTLLVLSADASHASAIANALSACPSLSLNVLKESSPDNALMRVLPSFEVDAVLIDTSADLDRALRFTKVARQHFPALTIIAWLPAPNPSTEHACLASGIDEILLGSDADCAAIDTTLQRAFARTQHRNAEDADRRDLNILLDSIPDNIYFKDREGRFLRVGTHMAHTIGHCEPQEMLGKSDADFFTGDHIATTYNEEQQVMHTRQPLVNNLEHHTLPNGEDLWFSTTRVPIIDATGEVTGTLGISRNVTTLLSTEKALDREKSFLRTILDAIDDTIFVKDAQGRYLLSNLAHTLSLGIDHPRDIIGKTAFDFFPEDLAQQFHNSDLEALHSGKPIINAVERRVSHDNTVRWFATSKIPFDNPQSGQRAIAGISREISYQVSLEERLGISPK